MCVNINSCLILKYNTITLYLALVEVSGATRFIFLANVFNSKKMTHITKKWSKLKSFCFWVLHIICKFPNNHTEIAIYKICIYVYIYTYIHIYIYIRTYIAYIHTYIYIYIVNSNERSNSRKIQECFFFFFIIYLLWYEF